MNASNEAPKEKNGVDWKFILRIGLALFLITAIAAFVLGLVNAVTADAIEERAQETRQAALNSVMPDADSFEDVDWNDGTIEGMTFAYSGSDFVGCCVETTPNGFGGAIDLMVGVDTDGRVTGVVILDHSETAGLGARADSPDFLDQYIGKTFEIEVNEDDENSIDALSGATITSKAVTLGVNTAIEAADNCMEEGVTP